MRSKVLLTALLVFIAVVGGGLAISWYFQAKNSKDTIEKFIAKINEKQPYLTYESIQTSGFPYEVRVAIVKPRFSGRIDELLKTAGHNDMAIDKNALAAWQEDVSLSGAITFSINALSDDYKVIVSGDWTSQATIGGKALTLASRSSGDSQCSLKLERSGGWYKQLWDFGSLARDGKRFTEDFRTLDCVFTPYTMADGAGKPAIASGGGRIYASHVPKGDDMELRLLLQGKDMEVLPDGEAVIMAYLNALVPNYPYPIAGAAFGKQNIDIDFVYNGPSDFKGPATMDRSIDAHLAKLLITNNLYSSSTMFRLTSSKESAERKAHWLLKSETTTSQGYNKYLQDMLRGVVSELYYSDDPFGSSKDIKNPVEFDNFRRRFTPEQTYDMIAPLIPDYAALGKLVLSNDVAYSGADNFSTANLAINDIEISAAPYGVTIKGTANKAATQMMPSANVVTECRNCPQLLSDLFNYAMRIERLIEAMAPPESAPSPTITPGLANGVQAFLRELSEPIGDKATQTLFRYTFLSDGAANMTISGKRADEVMALYAQHIAPHLPPLSPR